jgi:predicted GTPase
MTQSVETDIQAQSIGEGLTKLHELLEKPIAREALDLAKNAETAGHHEVLRRVRQSLRQYLGRDGDLFYVGLLGHFSAGKSSTINSLLQAWKSKGERNTGLNPTDTTITLITQSKNSSSLVGVIREGHVTIRHEVVETPMLENLVLVDTPGTGDPQFLEEIARDFLPICDVILFLLSAASPLDKSDLPLLSELHKRLQFIPIHFVITRADELRANFDKPLTDENLDHRRRDEFLGEVVSRINALLKPQVYSAEQFILIDNKSGFNVNTLRQFLDGKCNSSSPQARISMHLNKLHFYLSGARELKDFFATFLEAKLVQLRKIVAAAARNIERYQENVQISNSNLTKAWLDYIAALNEARSRATEPLKNIGELPEEYANFLSVIQKRGEISTELTRDAKFTASGVSANLKSAVMSSLRDHFYKAEKMIAETDFAELTASKHGIKTFTIVHEFKDGDLISPSMLSRRYNDLRSSQADALQDAATELRRTTKDLDELLHRHAPFRECEAVVQSARESLTKDLGQFFQNVELYRSGVFSHTTKESISTLGIGQQLDQLEAEFNDDDKSSFTAEAVGDLFPRYPEIAAKAGTQLSTLSRKTTSLLESVRNLKIEKPDDSYHAIENTATAASSTFRSDILRHLQSDVDRICANVNSTIASLLVNAQTDFDNAMRAVKVSRRKRYFRFGAITAVVLFFLDLGYFHYNLPAPESTLGAVSLHVMSGLIVESLVLIFARWREHVPRVATQTRERFHTNLNDSIRKAVEAGLTSYQFEALSEGAISTRLYQAYEHIFSSCTDSWHLKAVESLRTLRLLRTEYMAIRQEYLSFIDEIHKRCAQYFTDATKNLKILNAIARRIKERAIEPSFKLLDQTRQQLESVKEEVEAVEFT